VSTVPDDACSGPAGMARPVPWLVGGLVWLVALLLVPASDVVGADHVAGRAAALVLVALATAGAVLTDVLLGRSQRLVPLALLALLAASAVATTVAYGEPWWNTWVLLAATASGVLRGRSALLAVVGVPALAGLVLVATDATGAEVWTTVLVAFLAGAVNYLLVRLLQTIGDLRAAQRELAELAVLEERDRFGRDLHDLLGHTLSLVVVKAEAVRRLAQRDPEAAMQHTLDIEAIGREALVEVRDAVQGYRRPTLAGELARARDALGTAGVAVEVIGGETPLPPSADEALAWVVREGVTNVLRHAAAGRCTITLASRDGVARVEITDDGAGSDTSGASGASGGNGLAGLRERVALLGGELEAGPGPSGYRLAAGVPEGPAAMVPRPEQVDRR
jgi:two-component system, NarL family, sensor histidine kinase DesK